MRYNPFHRCITLVLGLCEWFRWFFDNYILKWKGVFLMNIHPRMLYTYVGADSHRDTHTLVFLNCFHEKIGEMTIANVPGEFSSFLKRAKKFLQPDTTFVFGFEDCTAYGRSLVKFLVEKGYSVKHINAVRVATERGSTLNKTDSQDAECCAKVLINEFDKLPNANPQDKYWTLGNLVSRRDAIVKINVMLKNSLHHALAEHYPHYKKFFSNLIVKSALDFYEQFPAPYLLDGMHADELYQFMKAHCQGRLSMEKALLILETIKRDNVPKTEYQDMKDFYIRSLIRQIKSNLAELAAIDVQIEKLMTEFDYPLTTMKGINTLTAAQLITEIGDINRFKSAASLAKFAGVAPFTYASGMSKLELANAKGNRKLNELTFRIALSAISPIGNNKMLLNHILHDYHKKKMSEGKVKNQATKCVQRRLINIIYGMMKHNKPYINPEVRYLTQD